MQAKEPKNLCLGQTEKSVTSISTACYVPQPLPNKSHYIQNRIFVGNIPLRATKPEIMYMFRQFGEITETNLIEDDCRRFGFVTFVSIDSADAVLSLYQRGRPFVIRGCPVTLNRAYFRPKKVEDGQSKYEACKPERELNNEGQTVTGFYCNGTVYYNPIPNVQNCTMPYCGPYNFNRPQPDVHYSPTLPPAPKHYIQPVPLPPPTIPVFQQMYQAKYNINHNVRIHQFVQNIPQSVGAAEHFETCDSGNASMQGGSSCEELNQIEKAKNDQEKQSNILNGYWCNDKRCCQNQIA